MGLLSRGYSRPLAIPASRIRGIRAVRRRRPADCSPATGNNATVTCKAPSRIKARASTPATAPIFRISKNGLTINVRSTASVTGTSIGINVGNNNTISNLGTITTAGRRGRDELAERLVRGRDPQGRILHRHHEPCRQRVVRYSR
jgi:hypothetical protein